MRKTASFCEAVAGFLMTRHISVASFVLPAKPFSLKKQAARAAPLSAMSRPSLAALAIFSATPLAFAQTSVPAKTTTPKMPAPEVLFLSGIPLDKTPEKIRQSAEQIYAHTEDIADPVLRRHIRLSLAQLIEHPQNAEPIVRDHRRTLSEFFYSSALQAQQAQDLQAFTNALQLAVHCNPGNAKAKLLWARLLFQQGGDAEKAIQTLQHGLEFLALDDPEVPAYLDFLFNLMAGAEYDRKAAILAVSLFHRDPPPPEKVRITAGLHAVAELIQIGESQRALETLAALPAATPAFQSTLLKSRALFLHGNTKEAVQLLDKSTASFKGRERDQLLSQLARFLGELGDFPRALSATEQRIQDFSDNPQPRVHRLYLLEKLGRTADFNSELQSLLADHSADQGTLLALANFASERGHPEIAASCYTIADRHNFNRSVFAILTLEAFIRGGKPQQAIQFYQRLIVGAPDTFKQNRPGVEALLAAAYFAINDPGTARRHLEEFLFEKQIDPDTLVTGTSRSRNLPAPLYVSVSQLLRFVGAPQDALRVLEVGRRAHPQHSQLLADAISTRIECQLTGASSSWKPLPDDILTLLSLRRPTPLVWRDILRWLETQPELTPKQKEVIPLVSRILARPDLTGIENRAARQTFP